MIRTNFHLSTVQKKKFQQLAKKAGVSTAEMIRRVLDRHLESLQVNQSVQQQPQ